MEKDEVIARGRHVTAGKLRVAKEYGARARELLIGARSRQQDTRALATTRSAGSGEVVDI